MGIQVEKRNSTAPELQKMLTDYGCAIKTRLGVHQASENECSEKGLIILEFLESAEKEARELEEKLLKLGGVTVKKMVF